MEWGEFVTRWSVRLALLLYVLSLALRAGSRGYGARLAWTAGYLAYLLHIICAFQFYHHWSHLAAYQATAQQTEKVVGLAWGGGLYVNYLFTLVWGLDVCWWWLRPQSHDNRPWGIEWALQGFLAFIAFNATVVFAIGAIRWLGLAACLFLVGTLVYVVYRHGQRGRV
jgi:hypothetical protein